MFEQKIKISNEIGLHARPASLFIQEAIKYSSHIEVIKNEKIYNGKSIMSVLSMSASKNDEIIIKAEGEDEEEAVTALVNLIKNL